MVKIDQKDTHLIFRMTSVALMKFENGMHSAKLARKCNSDYGHFHDVMRRMERLGLIEMVKTVGVKHLYQLTSKGVKVQEHLLRAKCLIEEGRL